MSSQDKDRAKPETWRDWLSQFESAAGGLLTWPLVIIPILVLILFTGINQLKSLTSGPAVIAYIAQDQVYAEPLLADFTQETGIRVRAVYDSEAVKTVGLANRLLAEAAHPQCDVFWGNEELRTRQLAIQDTWRATNGWAAFGYRSRRIVINNNFVRWGETPSNRTATPEPPRSLLELTNAVWRGKVALAYPIFGTTATHFLALRQHWGDPAWEEWCVALAANRPFVVDGNSVAAKLVAKGEAWLGLSDSDDIAAVQSEGAPVVALPLSEESLLIPNTVAVVRNAPHPEAAQRLFAWLQRPEVAARLVTLKALEGASAVAIKTPTLQPNWDKLVSELEAGTERLKEIFVR